MNNKQYVLDQFRLEEGRKPSYEECILLLEQIKEEIGWWQEQYTSVRAFQQEESEHE